MLPSTRLLSASPRKLCGTPPSEHLSPLHLCRALLREASYLPDETARTYFRGFILSRFRSYQPIEKGARRLREINKKPKDRLRTANINLRAPEKLRKGRQALSLLRRANDGDLKPLRRVLLAAYGRIGRRRHELIQPLLQPTVPSNSDELEKRLTQTPGNKKTLQELYHDKSRFLSFFDVPEGDIKPSGSIKITFSKRYPELHAVIRANGQYRPENNPRRVIRSTALTAPTINHWGRPMPVKRSKNMVREWYKEALEKVLPPLPGEEFDKLKGLAVKDIKWNLHPRRPTGTVRSDIASLEPMPGTLSEESSMDSSLEHTKRRLLQDLYPPRSVLVEPRDDRDRNRITPRFMLRMYQDIAALCCKTVWDPTWNRYEVIWGSSAVKEHLEKVWSTSIDTDLFAGVDEHGRLEDPSRRAQPLLTEVNTS